MRDSLLCFFRPAVSERDRLPLDWGASQFVSKNVHVGLAGYYFQQLTGDTGPGAKLGDFKGRVAGIGPQIGFIIPLSKEYQGYLNVKGYKDFAAENRAEGWTAWVTFAISSAPPDRLRRNRCTGNKRTGLRFRRRKQTQRVQRGCVAKPRSGGYQKVI
jgi:hypothetical protein